MRDVLEEYLPPGTSYNKMEQTYTLPSPWKSRIQVIQQAAGREQFQGARVRLVWIDEECPASQGGEEIFSEILARKKPGQPLDVLYTFTPTNGIDWSYRRLLDERSKERYPGVEIFNATIWDASISHGGWYTDEEIDEIAKKYPEHERAARLEGKSSYLSGSTYWQRDQLEAALKKCEKGTKKRIERKRVTIDLIEDPSSHLTIFRPVARGHQYIVAADPAGGVGRDRSVGVVIDRSDLAIVAVYSCDSIDPDAFGAEILLPLGMVYNEALIVVESNNHGGTVLSQLKGRYNNLWLRQDWNSKDSCYKSEYGWRTDLRTRDRIFDALSRALREDEWTPCEQLIDEMMTVVIDGDLKIQALIGYFDDMVMAAGIGYAVHYLTPAFEYPSRKAYEITYSGTQEQRWMAT